jgi:hypothetical protein
MQDLSNQDRIIWAFLFLAVASLYLLAIFDPSQRAAAVDITTKTLIPLLLREVIGGVVRSGNG